MGTNIDFNTESFAFLDSFRFKINGAKLALQHLLCLIEHPVLRLFFIKNFLNPILQMLKIAANLR